MADFTALKAAINAAIKTNGEQEITGAILQTVLDAIVETLGDGAINNLITALSNEATARGNADATLGGSIDGLAASITAINDHLTEGYVYAGIATTSTNPGIPSGKVFYLALTAGTYTNFGSTVVSQGINILKYNGSAWSLDSFIGIDDTPTPSSNNLVKSGGVFNDIMTNGSAFDLTAYNNGTTYADLDAALTALNALPAAYKKGGMSFKFVHSSDNTYVQYRYMGTEITGTPNPFLDIANWQGVDAEPTNGSDNFVKSNGIYQKNMQLGNRITNETNRATEAETQLGNRITNENNRALTEEARIEGILDTNRFGYNVTVFGLVTGVHTLATAVKNVPSTERFGGQKITFKTDSGWVTYQNTSLDTSDYENVANWVLDSGVTELGDVIITNNPDYEDLTQNEGGQLKFADKEYNTATYSGLGRIYLRKNIVGGVNTLTQAMMPDSNTIYHIQYDYDLAGETITIPENCVLKFDGGSLSNGTLVGDATTINNCKKNTFDGVVFSGTFVCNVFKLSWNKNNSNDGSIINNLINVFSKIDIDRNVALERCCKTDKSVEVFSSNDSTITTNCTPTSETSNALFCFDGVDNISFHDLNIDYNQQQFSISVGEVIQQNFAIHAQNVFRADIYNVTIKNYGKLNSPSLYDRFHAIIVSGILGGSINVHDCSFYDIHCTGNGVSVSDSLGNGTCIYVFDDNISIINIFNNNFIRCYGIDTLGHFVIDDFDCIRVYNTAETMDTSVVIEHCYFENVSKRGIKAQSANIHIRDIVYRNTDENVCCSAFISLFGDRCIVDGVDAKILGGDVNSYGGETIIDVFHNTNVTVKNVTAIATLTEGVVAKGMTVSDGIIIGNCMFYNLDVAIRVIEQRALYGFDYEFGDNDIVLINNTKFKNCKSAITNATKVKVKANNSIFDDCQIFAAMIELSKCGLYSTMTSDDKALFRIDSVLRDGEQNPITNLITLVDCKLKIKKLFRTLDNPVVFKIVNTQIDSIDSGKVVALVNYQTTYTNVHFVIVNSRNENLQIKGGTYIVCKVTLENSMCNFYQTNTGSVSVKNINSDLLLGSSTSNLSSNGLTKITI